MMVSLCVQPQHRDLLSYAYVQIMSVIIKKGKAVMWPRSCLGVLLSHDSCLWGAIVITMKGLEVH